MVAKAPVLIKTNRAARQQHTGFKIEKERFMPFMYFFYDVQLSCTCIFTHTGKTLIYCKTCDDIENSLPNELFYAI